MRAVARAAHQAVLAVLTPQAPEALSREALVALAASVAVARVLVGGRPWAGLGAYRPWVGRVVAAPTQAADRT